MRRSGHHVEERNPEIDGRSNRAHISHSGSVKTVVNLASHPTAGRPAREGEVERITWLTRRWARKSALRLRSCNTNGASTGRQMAPFTRRDVSADAGTASPAVKLGWLDMMMDDVANTGGGCLRSLRSPSGSTSQVSPD